MRRAGLLVIAAALTTARSASAGERELLFAAPLQGGEAQSPRKLFNAGLAAEEQGNLVKACQLYLAARLGGRVSYADEHYARGASFRLLEILAGHDDDAAVAAALTVANATSDAMPGAPRQTQTAEQKAATPLVRTLLNRLESEGPGDLLLISGTLISVRYQRSTGGVLAELEGDDGERRALVADGLIGPFSAGHRVRALIRRSRGLTEAQGWLVALSAEHADGWQLIRTKKLPGTALRPDGVLLGSMTRSEPVSGEASSSCGPSLACGSLRASLAGY